MAHAYRLISALLCLLAQAGTVQAQVADGYRLDIASALDATYLIELRQGSRLSALARTLSSGGFETATGNRVDFRSWYSSHWTDTHIAWMTQITPNIGIIHGFSTGERGSKYTIEPSLKLGVAVRTRTGKNAFLSLRATTLIGGALREMPCAADYGAIGGVQTVNCRLAATLLPPEQTLGYLVKEKPPDRHQAMLMFDWSF